MNEIVFIGTLKIKYRLPLILNAFKVLYMAFRGYEQTIKTEKDTLINLLKENEIEFTRIIAFKTDSNYLTIYVFKK